MARAFFRTPGGSEYNKAFFVPGSFAGGYSSLVSGAVNRFNVETLTECAALTGDYRELARLLDIHPALERLARRIAESFYMAKESRELDLAMLDGRQRYDKFRQTFPELEKLIPQYHVASYLGITPTQLSRIRSRR